MKTPAPTPDALIVLRTTRERKGRYLRASREQRSTLAAWMFQVCDEATTEASREQNQSTSEHAKSV